MIDPVGSQKSSSVPMTDQILSGEHFDENSAAVKTGGQMSLINVQKDVDTLLKNKGTGVTRNDLTKDLKATGLSDADAADKAGKIIAETGSGDTAGLSDDLSSLFTSQGGLGAEDAQALANYFLTYAGENNTSSYQTQEQKTDWSLEQADQRSSRTDSVPAGLQGQQQQPIPVTVTGSAPTHVTVVTPNT